MSCCLIIQNKNNIIIGADTASSTIQNGIFVRSNNNVKKIFTYKNDVIFCSGEMTSVGDVIQHIQIINDYVDIIGISKFLKQNYLKNNGYINVEMVICRIENNTSYMYQLSQYNNFDIKINTVTHNYLEIYSAGINTKKCLSVAEKELGQSNNIKQIYINTFNQMVSEVIGGNINVYYISQKGISQIVTNHQLCDKYSLIFKKSFKKEFFLIADSIVGKLFVGEKLVIGDKNDTVTIDDNGIHLKKGAVIDWSRDGSDGVKPPDIEDIDGLPKELEDLNKYIEQVDGRIQTFSQNTDPRNDSSWGKDSDHTGDLWVNPDTGITKQWTGTKWKEVTDSYLKSLVDSKAQIFTAKPTVVYFKGDLIIPAEDFTYDNVTYKHEQVYRAINNSNGTTFSNSDWDALDYTNDDYIINFINGDYAKTIETIKSQVDGKARAWYMDTDPSDTNTNTDWDVNEDHDGDLWYNTSATSQVTSIYKNGEWQPTNVPKAVFDTIDGKRQIFVRKPSSTSKYMTGDLWVISESDCTNGKIIVNGITYNANSTLIAVLPNGVTERTSFTESDWTDISTQDGIVALDQSTQALNKFSDIANDSKITPTEKQSIKLLYDNITAEKKSIINDCIEYEMNNSTSSYYTDYDNFNKSFTSLKTLFDSILGNMETTIDVPSNYQSTINDYYTKYDIINTDIQKASKKYSESVLKNFVEGDYAEALQNINTQIDGKTDTFYQSTMPHTEYTNIASNTEYDLYVGDLWYNPTTGESKMYQKTANGSNFDYKWEYMDVPQEVYNKINGVASIYVTLPSNPNTGDLLIPNSNITSGSKTYIAKKVYKYDGSSWIEINYTDDTKANEVEKSLDAYKEEINEFRDNVNTALTGSSTTEIGSDYVISPKIGGGYLYIKDTRDTNNTGISVEINPNGTNFTGHNTDYVFNIQKDNDIIMGVDTDGNGYFSGAVSIYGENTMDRVQVYAPIKDKGDFYTRQDMEKFVCMNNISASKASTGAMLGRSWFGVNNTSSLERMSPTLALWKNGDLLGAESLFAIQPDGMTTNYIIYSYINNMTYMPIGVDDSGIHTDGKLYSGGTEIQTSDERFKDEISNIAFDDRYETLFMNLKPKLYKYKNFNEYDHHDRIHSGFFAQEVKEAMDIAGISDIEFGAFCYTNYETDKVHMIDGLTEEECRKKTIERNHGFKDKYMLGYTEFIALNTHMIQKNIARLDILEKENEKLKQEIKEIKEMIANM